MDTVVQIVFISIMLPSIGALFLLIIKLIRDQATARANHTIISNELQNVHGILDVIQGDLNNLSVRVDLFLKTETDTLKQMMMDNTNALRSIGKR